MSEKYLRSLCRAETYMEHVFMFNLRPLDYLAPERLQILFPSAPPVLCQSPRARRSFARTLAGAPSPAAGLQDTPAVPLFWNFTTPHRRLALLGPSLLLRLVLFTGLTACSRQIAGLIRREEVLKLRQAIGSTAYDFALKRAPFLVGKEVRWFADGSQHEDPYRASLQAGVRCLKAALLDEPSELLERVALELPPDVALQSQEQQGQNVTQEPARPGEVKKYAFDLLRTILCREVSPQWAAVIS